MVGHEAARRRMIRQRGWVVKLNRHGHRSCQNLARRLKFVQHQVQANFLGDPKLPCSEARNIEIYNAVVQEHGQTIKMKQNKPHFDIVKVHLTSFAHKGRVQTCIRFAITCGNGAKAESSENIHCH